MSDQLADVSQKIKQFVKLRNVDKLDHNERTGN
jgi:hypothetical protein